MFFSPMRIRACRPTADLTSTCQQTELKDHQCSLGVTCSQHVEFPNRFLLSRPELAL